MVHSGIQKLKQVLIDRELSQIQLQKLTVKAFPPKGVSLNAIRSVACGQRDGRYILWKLAVTLKLPRDHFDAIPKKKRASA